MAFGISNNIRCRTVNACTPELFFKTVRSAYVGTVCGEIEDALERVRRGEICREDYEEMKSGLKKRLPIFTPHATFANGHRKNAEAIPSGLSMYDIDHIADPRGYFAERIEPRVAELGVALAHVTPSLEGLRLFFIIPEGMGLAAAQRWMSERLGDADYDSSVKDYARSSFAVPEDYILYINEIELFKERKAEKIDDEKAYDQPVEKHSGKQKSNVENPPKMDIPTPDNTPATVNSQLSTSKAFPTPGSSPSGFVWRMASRNRESAMTSCTALPLTCAT